MAKMELKFWAELAPRGKGFRIVDCSTCRDNLPCDFVEHSVIVRGTGTVELPAPKKEKKAKAKK